MGTLGAEVRLPLGVADRLPVHRRPRRKVSSDISLNLDSAGLQAPAQARAWISEQTAGAPTDLVQDALLVASELVTNAVRHGQPEITLGLRRDPECLVVEVSDGGDGLPVLPAAKPPPGRPAGRGLLIVAATATDWGVRTNPDRPGKTVWAQLGPLSG